MSDKLNETNKLQFVGFDGSPSVDSAPFLLIGRHTEEDIFFRFSPRTSLDTSPVFSSIEMKNLVDKNIVTLFSEPVSFQPDKILLYLSHAFLNALNGDLSQELREVDKFPSGICYLADDNCSTEILDFHARDLVLRATDLIVSFFREHSISSYEDAKHVLNLARQAACSPSLRAKIFLRIGILEKFSNIPEKIENLFHYRIKKEFPDWTWSSFQLSVSKLSEIFHERALIFKIAKPSEIEPVYLQIIINTLINGLEEADERSQLERCVELAADFQKSYYIAEDDENDIEGQRLKLVTQKVAVKILYHERIRVNFDELMILGCEPAFYNLFMNPNYKRPFEFGDFIRSFDFIEAINSFKKAQLFPGSLAEFLFSCKTAAA